MLRFLHLRFEGGVLLVALTNPASLRCIHLVLGCLLDDIVVLQAYYLVYAIPQSGHFLTLLMQQILRQTEFNDRIVAKLPLIFSSHRLNNFLLLRTPIPLSIWTLHVRLRPLICRILIFFLIILLLVEVVERNLPDAGEEDLGAVTDLRYPTRQVATFFTRLQRLVYVDDLFKTLSKVTGPHLIFNVLVPHA